MPKVVDVNPQGLGWVLSFLFPPTLGHVELGPEHAIGEDHFNRMRRQHCDMEHHQDVIACSTGKARAWLRGAWRPIMWLDPHHRYFTEVR